MKKNLKSTVLIPAILIILFTGCKKDNNDEESTQYFRLAETKMYNDSAIVGKTTYKYSGDRLTEVISYSYGGNDTLWTFINKIEFSYPDGNTLEEIFYNYLNGEWKESSKVITTHQNGLWQHSEKYSPSGVLIQKTDYTYDGGRILNKKSFIKSQEGMELNREYSFTWVGPVPSTAEYHFGIGSPSGFINRDTLTFSNNRVEKIESNVEYLKNDFMMKQLFQYSGDKVSSIAYYYNDSGNWTEQYSYLFNYDEYGNLISNIRDSFQWTYKYEKSKGNLSFIYGISTDFYFIYFPFPALSGIGKNGIGHDLLINCNVPSKQSVIPDKSDFPEFFH